VATRHARNEPGGVRRSNVAAFLDAAERLLVEKGYSAITTRNLAAEAGLNPGLVHYYFGSIDEVLVQVAERFTARLTTRQREMYASDAPFLEKWRTATRYLEEDLAAGYPKVFFELLALSWNRPQLQERVQALQSDWRAILTEAFERAADEYGLEREAVPIDVLVALVMTFQQGLHLQRLSGIADGHAALLAWVDGRIESLERRRVR
jgi:AcrR family transcriptional regulator